MSYTRAMPKKKLKGYEIATAESRGGVPPGVMGGGGIEAAAHGGLHGLEHVPLPAAVFLIPARFVIIPPRGGITFDHER